MIPVGTITVTPETRSIEIGSFSLAENHDTIWIDVQRTSPDQGWPWSFGILGWKTEFGYELGKIKAYTEPAGEVIRLGVGRAPRSRTGRLFYEPRSFNLAWVEKGYSLTLAFSAASGVGGGVPVSGGTLGVAFPVQGGTWRYIASTGLVQLEL
jgi:hypothetical protein